MVEISLLIEENKLLDIIYKKLQHLVDSSNYEIICKYMHSNISNGSATFFFAPCNLDSWLEETVSRLRVVVPYDDDYKHWLELWDDEIYEDGKYVVQEKHGQQLLVEEL